MEEWMNELELRLQEDETYQLWVKGAQNLLAHLEASLKGRDLHLLVDYSAAMSTKEVLRLYQAYQLGVEHGLKQANPQQ